MCEAKRLLTFVVLLVSASIGIIEGSATAAAETTSPATTYVFVPYDRVRGPEFGLKQSVLLPYAEFLRLKAAAVEKPETPDFRPMVSISQSSFKGAVEGNVARLDGEFVVETIARPKDALEIELPFSGASVESVSIEDPQASVAPLAKETGLKLFLRGSGRRVLKLRLAAPLTAEEAAKRLDIRVPRAAASSLSLRVGEDVALESVAESLPATVAPAAGGGVEIKASCGSRDRLLLVYRPKAEATGAAAQTRIAIAQDYRLSVSGRSAGARIRMDVNVLAGNAASVAVQIPPTARLLAVTGSFVKDWSAPDRQGNSVVALVRPVSRPFDLTFDVQFESAEAGGPAALAGAEARTTAPAARLAVPEFRVPGAARESGTITVTPDAGLSVWPEEVAGLEMVSTGEAGPAARAFRFAQPGWKLTLSRRLTPSRVRSDGTILYEVTEEFVRLKSRHHLAVGGRGIFDVTFQAPEKYELREAGPPELVSGFRVQGQQVLIILRSEQRAACDVTLSFQRPRTAADMQIRLEPISVVGADEDAGCVVLAMPVALRATEKGIAGLEATDVRTLQERVKPLLSSDLSPVMGYRYFAPKFTADALIERQRTRITCETARLASILPSLMRINATLNYNIEFSATDELQMLVPASVGEDVRFDGADIKEKVRSTAPPATPATTDTLTTWTVRLQRRVLGPYSLNVSFDVPLPPAQSGEALKVAAPMVRATQVARETGFVAVSRGENLEVRVARSEGLEPRDVKELPPTLANAFLGFRYFDPARQLLELELIRHELESVLGALIRRMHVETVMSDQRRVMHEVFFEVQNNRQQYLELKLPKGMEILAAFVRGLPVRPTIRQSDGAHLIELTKSEAMDKAFRVRLVLGETLPGGAMKLRGRLKFEPPEPINMPILRTTWKLFLPRNYRYVWFGGTMQEEIGGHVAWIEPAAESLLNDIPAGLAGGIARPALQPPQVQAPIQYDTNESEEEKRLRLQGSALEIPIVREGLMFNFSKISGTGLIEASYWKRKALVVLQGAVGLAILLILLGLMAATQRLGIGIAAVVIALIAASLTEGLTGRLLATSLAASAAALVLALAAYALHQVHTMSKRAAPALAPEAAPAPEPPQAAE